MGGRRAARLFPANLLGGTRAGRGGRRGENGYAQVWEAEAGRGLLSAAANLVSHRWEKSGWGYQILMGIMKWRKRD